MDLEAQFHSNLHIHVKSKNFLLFKSFPACLYSIFAIFNIKSKMVQKLAEFDVNSESMKKLQKAHMKKLKA